LSTSINPKLCAIRKPFCRDKAAITTLNATRESVEEAARRIYNNHPEILNALGL
jgi:hypothetical protein